MFSQILCMCTLKFCLFPLDLPVFPNVCVCVGFKPQVDSFKHTEKVQQQQYKNCHCPSPTNFKRPEPWEDIFSSVMGYTVFIYTIICVLFVETCQVFLSALKEIKLANKQNKTPSVFFKLKRANAAIKSHVMTLCAACSKMSQNALGFVCFLFLLLQIPLLQRALKVICCFPKTLASACIKNLLFGQGNKCFLRMGAAGKW